MVLPKLVSPARAGLVSSLCLFLLRCLAPESVTAQTLQQQQLEQTRLAQYGAQNWSVFLGAAIATSNTYDGAQSYRTHLAPILFVSYHDEFFFGPLGLEWKAIDWNGFRAGPVLGFLGGRPQDVDAHLYGLGDIPASFAAGMFADYRLGHFQLSANFRQAIRHREDGWLGLVQLDYSTLIARRLVFFIGPEVQFASRTYEQTFFGVTAVQSLYSGLPVFTPAGGTKDYGMHTGLSYVATRHLFVRAFANVKWFSSDISGSPIVQRNSQTLIGIGIAYRF